LNADGARARRCIPLQLLEFSYPHASKFDLKAVTARYNAMTEILQAIAEAEGELSGGAEEGEDEELK
jgi:hypothetical protein